MRAPIHRLRTLRRRPPGVQEAGYVAIVVAMCLPLLFGMAAFTLDVGRWYITGQKAQRAADAAALAGVPSLPGDQATAFSTAQDFASTNGFTNGSAGAVVVPSIAGKPTRLRVRITKTMSNYFGKLLGVPTTTFTRVAVADYAGPIPMGSPCNEMGDDPAPGSNKSTNCSSQAAFWGLTGGPSATKHNGDAYQELNCNNGDDGCTGSPLQNTVDYNPNGHFYSVTLTRAVTNLKLEVFDPVFVDVDSTCDWVGANLAGAAAIPPANAFVNNPSVRYAPGPGSWCTGDKAFNRNPVKTLTTKFTIRSPGASTNAWDPMTFDEMTGACAASTFPGSAATSASRWTRPRETTSMWAPTSVVG